MHLVVEEEVFMLFLGKTLKKPTKKSKKN